MSRKGQKVRTTPTGDWIYCSFSAHPEEIIAYREVASKLDRSLSWWVRDVLNKAAQAAKEDSNGAHEKVPMETISADRPRSDFES